jgi:hypothetical protein
MAQYRAKGPDGRMYKFEGPDGLSNKDASFFLGQYLNLGAGEEELAPVALPPKAPETGFIPSVKRGAMQTGMLLGDVLPAMLGRAVGADEYADRQLREAAETQRQIQEKYPAAVPSFTDIKGAGDVVTYITEAVGEAIPSILPGLFTGGAASVLGRGAVAAAKEAAEKAALSSVAKGVAKEEAEKIALQAGVQAARSTALKYQATGAITGSAAQNIPEVYQNILEETGKEDLGAALVSGGFNAVLDAILPIQLLRKAKVSGIPESEIIGAWYKRGAAGLGKGFLTEGATEAVQEMSSAAAEAFVGDNTNFFTSKNLLRFIDAGLKGGVGGGVITGATDIAFGRAPSEVEAKAASVQPTLEDVAAEEAKLGIKPAAPAAPEAPPAAPVVQTVTPPATPTDVPGITPGALEQIQSTPPTTTETGKPSKAAQLGKAQADLVQMQARGAPETALNKKRKQIERLTNEIAAESQTATTPPIAEGAPDVAAVVPTVSGAGVQVPEPADTGAAAPGVREAERAGVVPAGADVGLAVEGESEQPGAVAAPIETTTVAPRTKRIVQDEIMAVDEQQRALLSKNGRRPVQGTEKFRQWDALEDKRTSLFSEWRALDIQEKNAEPAAAPTALEETAAPIEKAPTKSAAIKDATKRTVEPQEVTDEGLTEEELAASEPRDPLLDEIMTIVQGGDSDPAVIADTYSIPLNRAQVLVDEAKVELAGMGLLDEQINEKENEDQTAPAATATTVTEEKPLKGAPKTITAGGRETRGGYTSGGGMPGYVAREIAGGNSRVFLNVLRTASENPVHRAVAQLLFAKKLFPEVTGVKSLPGGRVAQYDPKARKIEVTPQAQDDPGVLLHEYVHDATIKVINAYLTGGKLTPEQKRGAQHLQYLMKQSRSELSGTFPRAYDNLYEFVSYGMTNERFMQALSKLRVPAEHSYTRNPGMWDNFVSAIAKLLGFKGRDTAAFAEKLGLKPEEATNERIARRVGLTPDTMNTEMFAAFMDIVAPPPAAGIDMATMPATVQAEPIDTSDDGRMAQFEKETEIKERGFKKTLKNWFTKKGAIAATVNFQNDRYFLKRWEDRLARLDLIDRITDKLNNVYGQITRAGGMGVDIYNTNMKFLTQEVQDAAQAYATATGTDIRKALARLHLIFEARHEPERRRVKFLLNVPLDPLGQKIVIKDLITDPDLQALFPSITYSPSAFREQVLKILSTPTPGVSDVARAARARELRSVLDKIVDDPANHDTTAKTRLDKRGKVIKLEDPFNEQGPDYSVIAGRTPQDIALITRMLDTAENKAAIDRVAKAMRAVSDKTIELNKQANYFSQPSANIIDFYGFNNYIPFKGRPGATQVDEELEIGSKRIGGELQEGQDRMEGRLSESENSVLQVLADGASSALRAGRKDLTLAIKNAVDQKRMRGGSEKISFEDRFLDRVSKETLGGPNKIFHYNADGTIDVVKIDDKQLSEAIRRQYRESSPIIDVANNITSFVGMMHTRYNPSFAPMNFVRDALTNAFTLGAELGPAQSMRLLSQVASDVSSGGMAKALRYSVLYANGKFDEIEKLAAKDSYYKDMQDYVKMGGRVSYLQGVAAKGALDQLIEEVGVRQVGANKIATLLKKQQIDKFLDIYNDMFELSSRVATYRIMRDNLAQKNTARGMGKEEAAKDAQIQAVEYAKNLANFEQVGKYGKEAGSLFMFFRPAATGAVRAIEALAPAFMPFDKKEFELEAKQMGATDAQVANAVKEMQQRKASARRMSMALMGVGAMAFYMAVMMSGDDDEGRNRILTDDMARWSRYARFHIPGTDMFFQIPWGFGLGWFASTGAQLASVLTGTNSLQGAFGNMLTTYMDSFLPLPVSRINPFENPGAFVIDSALPSVARPIVEYMMNIDGLGREIYNNKQNRFGDAYTGGDNIPEAYKLTARKMFDMTNGAIDVSPNSLHFFASNYVDGIAKVMTNSANLAMTATGYKDPDIRNDVALLASFFGTKSNFDAREFSKVEKDILAMDQRIKALKNRPEMLQEYLQDHATDYALVQFYNQAVNGTLRQLRAQANVIRANPELSMKERKAQLDEIVKLQNHVKRDLLNGFEAVGGIKP